MTVRNDWIIALRAWKNQEQPTGDWQFQTDDWWTLCIVPLMS